MAISALAWAFSRSGFDRRLAIPLLVTGGCLFQVLPLPDRVLMALAPISGGAWKVALGGNDSAWGCISIDPGATLIGIRRLLLGISTIFVVADVARTESPRRLLYGAIALSGMAIVLLGLAFPTTTDDRLAMRFIDLSGPIWFWKTPVDAPVQTAGFSESDWVVVGNERYVSDSWIVGDRIGPYIVSNHFAAGVYLTLPILLAGLLALPRTRTTMIAAAAVAIVAAGAGFWAVAIVAKSRAGTLALLLSLLTLGWLTARPRWLRMGLGIATLLSGLIVIGGALVLHGPLHGVEALLPQRLQPPLSALLNDARVVASRLAGRMFAASPVFGTGLGSYYEIAARMLAGAPPLAFAHNDYAQWLAETGLLGGLVLALAIGWMGWLGATFARLTPTPETTAAAGAWAALAGIAAHSFFDWNLHVPANAFLTAVVAGLAIASVSSARQPALRRTPAGLLNWVPRVVFGVAVIASLGLLGRDAMSATVERTMRAALADARLAAADPKRPSAKPALTAAVDAGERATRWDPANARLWLLLGQIELHLAALEPNDAALVRQAAAARFTRAQQCSATVRGLPELVPPKPPKNSTGQAG